MKTRRSFLTTLAGGAAAAVAMRAGRAAGSGKPPVGLQLYSLRDELKRDVPGTLRQVKAWGIDEVEGYGEYAAPIAGKLRDAGLRCGAMHVDYKRLADDLPGVLRDADAVGAKTIVNPYLPHEARPFATREEILKAAGDFAKWSKACRAAGKRFAYHIHGQEFGKTADGTLFDLLAKESGPDTGFEADVFWITVGGQDPVALMNRYPGRFWLTHLKDMAKSTDLAGPRDALKDKNVVLGTGRIDIKGIVAAGAKAGVDMHYIEDESPAVLSQVPQSLAFYRAL
jgi:sugar phosphate isomerase/epimerase